MTTPIGRCYACNGSKKLMGMGLMLKDCYVCDGVGHIVVKAPVQSCNEPISVDNKSLPLGTIDKPTPKPTRYKKPAPVIPIDKRSKAWRDRNKPKPIESTDTDPDLVA